LTSARAAPFRGAGPERATGDMQAWRPEAEPEAPFKGVSLRFFSG
jgi:hypothetical protein